MSNILDFPINDIQYITGNADRGEPSIVGVRCKDISIQLSCDLHNILLGDIEIKREELIAFVLGTGIHHDLVGGEANVKSIMYTVSEIDGDGFTEEIETFECIEKAYELKLALNDSASFNRRKAQYEILAHKYICGYRV